MVKVNSMLESKQNSSSIFSLSPYGPPVLSVVPLQLSTKVQEISLPYWSVVKSSKNNDSPEAHPSVGRIVGASVGLGVVGAVGAAAKLLKAMRLGDPV